MANGFELSIERHFDVPPEAVWTALTDHLTEWWCPKPWTTEIVKWELRPGGASHLILRGPDGESSENAGVFLEVTAPHRLVFTDAVSPDWQPQKPFIIGIFHFADDGKGGTNYRASCRHWSEQAMQEHAEMGFEIGWGMAADQLLAVARRIAGKTP